VTLYEVAQKIVLPPLLRLWRFKTQGRENVPLTGPLIVACNHASYMDPVALGVACPRPLSYMAKIELFSMPILGPLIKRLNAYPVERFQSPIAGIKKSVEMLREGKALGIFPQGTRVRNGVGEFQEGVALLASLGKAPVVPARIFGSDHATSFHQIKVAFGPSLQLPADRKASREDLANFTADIMRAIQELRPSL